MSEDISNYKLVSVDEGFNRGNMFEIYFGHINILRMYMEMTKEKNYY